jgi:hypothetical protein
VLSKCEADVQGDSAYELVAISRSNGETPFGPHGRFLYILSSKGFLGFHEVISSFDLLDAKPLKVMAGDVNRDGINEVSVIVCKTAEFHPVEAQRPFFFNVSNGKLEAVWLGSRLSQPFLDYCLVDLDGDGFEEIASLEITQTSFLLASYSWDSFGFVCTARSFGMESLETIAPLPREDGLGRILAGQSTKGGMVYRTFFLDGEALVEESETCAPAASS